MMRGIKVGLQLLGLLALTVLSLNAAEGIITITDFKVLYPTDESFQVVVAAVASGETSIGSYGIRTQTKLPPEKIPPGFILTADGYNSPEKKEVGSGDRDNGPFDEDPQTGVYARTFSTKGWQPGAYDFLVSAHNRPATGTYIYDGRTFRININQAGKISAPVIPLPPPGAKNIIIYKEAGAYACFPSLIQMKDGTLVTGFSARIKRSHIDPAGENITMCSRDGGLTWTKTTESFLDPKLRTKDGKLVNIVPEAWQYVPDSERPRLKNEDRFIMDVRPGTIAYLSPKVWVRTSADNGKTWETAAIPVPEYISGLMNHLPAADYLVTSQGTRLRAVYGFRKGVVKPGGEEVFFCRSTDEGKTWQFIPLLPDGWKEGPGFNETALLETGKGEILAMMRSVPTGFLWQSFSKDNGLTWSRPEKTPMWGHPAHLLRLPGGEILCSYGYRTSPMGIRACVSRDNGRTWDIAKEYILRADGQGNGGDLGYPQSVLLSDGSIFTIYYFNGEDNITHIAATIWRPSRAADIEKETLRNQSLTILQEALNKETRWVKIHAAEVLLSNNYPKGVRETFLAEETNAEPPYRIGVWRVLARANWRDKTLRRKYLDKIRDAFLDETGPDRLHAVETLAKLGYSERPAELVKMAQSGPQSLQVYSRWALANSGKAVDEAALAEFLGSPDAGTREVAAYGFFKLRRINAASLAALEKALASEPANSNSREKILGALYVHSAAERRKIFKPEILKYAETGSTGQKIMAAEILARHAEKTNLPLLSELLKSENPDLRIFSAGAILKITAPQPRYCNP